MKELDFYSKGRQEIYSLEYRENAVLSLAQISRGRLWRSYVSGHDHGAKKTLLLTDWSLFLQQDTGYLEILEDLLKQGFTMYAWNGVEFIHVAANDENREKLIQQQEKNQKEQIATLHTVILDIRPISNAEALSRGVAQLKIAAEDLKVLGYLDNRQLLMEVDEPYFAQFFPYGLLNVEDFDYRLNDEMFAQVLNSFAGVQAFGIRINKLDMQLNELEKQRFNSLSNRYSAVISGVLFAGFIMNTYLSNNIKHCYYESEWSYDEATREMLNNMERLGNRNMRYLAYEWLDDAGKNQLKKLWPKDTDFNSFSKIKEVNYCGLLLCTDNAEQLLKMGNDSRFQAIKELTIKGDTLNISQALSLFKNVGSLTISNFSELDKKIEVEGVKKIILNDIYSRDFCVISGRRLEQVEINNENAIGLPILRFINCPKLRRLKITSGREINIEIAVLASYLVACPTVNNLILTYKENKFTGEEFVFKQEYKFNQIQKLSLSFDLHEGFDEKPLSILDLKKFLGRFPAIQYLDFSCNFLRQENDYTVVELPNLLELLVADKTPDNKMYIQFDCKKLQRLTTRMDRDTAVIVIAPELKQLTLISVSIDYLPFISEKFPNLKYLIMRFEINSGYTIDFLRRYFKSLERCSKLQNISVEADAFDENLAKELHRYFAGQGVNFTISYGMTVQEWQQREEKIEAPRQGNMNSSRNRPTIPPSQSTNSTPTKMLLHAWQQSLEKAREWIWYGSGAMNDSGFQSQSTHPQPIKDTDKYGDGDKKKTSKVRRFFRNKNHKNPDPRSYRLRVYDTIDANNVLTASAPILEEKSLPKDGDPERYYEQQDRDKDDVHFLGQITETPSGEAFRLPSLSPNDKIVSLHASIPVKFYYAKNQALYYVQAKDKHNTKAITISYVLKRDFRLPSGTDKRLAELEEKILKSSVKNCLVRACSLKKSYEGLPKNNQESDTLKILISSNDYHSTAESYCGDIGYSYELGGADCKVEILTFDFKSPKVTKQKQQAIALDEMELKSNPYSGQKISVPYENFQQHCEYLQSELKKTDANEQNVLLRFEARNDIELYCDLRKKELEKIGVRCHYLKVADIDVNKRYLKENGVIEESSSELNQVLQTLQPGDELLVDWSDYDPEQMGHNSMMDKESRNACDMAIKAGIKVIALLDQRKMGEDFLSRFPVKQEVPAFKGNSAEAEFIANFTNISEATSADEVKHISTPLKTENQTETESKQVPRTAKKILSINLYNNPDWESLLKGKIHCDLKTNRLLELPGALTALAVKCNNDEINNNSIIEYDGIEFINGPTELASFRLFCKRLHIETDEQCKEDKPGPSFEFNGRTYTLPKNFIIKVKSEPYRYGGQYNVEAFKPMQSITWQMVLNTGTFKQFIEEQPLAWLTLHAKTSKSPLVILVTENLSEGQWAQLLVQAQQHSVRLHLLHLPNVCLPVALVKNATPIENESKKTNEFKITKGINEINETKETKPIKKITVICSNDIEECAHKLKELGAINRIIPVSEHTTFEDLIANITAAQQEEKHQKSIQLTSSINILWSALKSGENVALRGKLSSALARQLESLFATPPYLCINGEKQLLEGAGNLSIITEQSDLFSALQTPVHDTSQSKTKQNKTITLVNDKNQSVGVRERFTAITEALQQSHSVALMGSVDCGIAEVMRIFSLYPEKQIFTDPCLWAKKNNTNGNDTNDKREKILFIRNAHLMTAEELAVYDGLTGEPPHIILNQRYYELTDEHKVIFDRKANNHCVVVHFPAWSENILRELTLDILQKTLLKNHKIDQYFGDIINIFISVYKTANHNNNDNPMTSNNLNKMCLRLMNYMEKYSQVFNGDLMNMVTMAAYEEARHHFGNKNLKNIIKEQLFITRDNYKNLKKKLGEYWYDCYRKHRPQHSSRITIPAERYHTMRLLHDQIDLWHRTRDDKALAEICPQAIVLEGPSGIGKSQTVADFFAHYGYQNGKQLTHDNINTSDDKREDKPHELPKIYLHVTSMNMTKMLTRIKQIPAQQAIILWFDEYNVTATQDRMKLMQLIDERKNLFLIATQNSMGFMDRKKLLSDELIRLSPVPFKDYTRQAYVDIIKLATNTQHQETQKIIIIEQEVDCYLQAKAHAQKNYLIPPTLRDLRAGVEKKLCLQAEMPISQQTAPIGYGTTFASKQVVGDDAQQLPANTASLLNSCVIS